MTRRASAIGAVLRAAPSQQARVVGFLSSGLEVQGDVVVGERVHDEPRWIEVTGYVWVGRLVEGEDLLPPKGTKR